MRMRNWLVIPSALVLVTGCGATDLARSAADATACKALSSTIKSINLAYQSGLIDSGFVSQINNLVGEPAKALLSTGLAEDLTKLTDALSQTNTAEASRNQSQEITDSIAQRCADAGVNNIGG
jgi:hypothetical protein